MKSKILYFSALSFIFSSCSVGAQPPVIEVKEDLNVLENVEFDYDNSFFDDFSNGVNSSNWFIGNQAWGGGNGGVLPKNVHYTDDGVLQLVGNGAYYTDNDLIGVGDVKDGRYTGAALISKFKTKPGRYQIRMKALPRLGACTAFWTYAYKFNTNTDNLNHEIDIELPGGNRSGIPSFTNILNTNYETETKSNSQDTKLSDIFDKEVYLNDGDWHTFGFDWYTNPKKVVYYVDNKICAISDFFVPDLESRLWLGVWFPVSSSFVGSPLFESDSMKVDWVKYIPFKDQPYTPFDPAVNGVALENEYPKKSESLFVSDMVSNGDFEYLKNNQKENKGWDFKKYLSEKQELDLVSNVEKGIGFDGSYGAFIKDGGVLQQSIDSIYQDFKYDFEFASKVEGGKGKVTIQYLGYTESDLIETEVFEITNNKWEKYKKEIIVPEGTYSIKIFISSEQGNTLYIDDVSLINKG